MRRARITSRAVDTDCPKTPKVPRRCSDEGPSSALPAFAGQRDLGAVIYICGVATTCGTTALSELAETSETLHFRLLVHVDSLAIGASGLDARQSDVERRGTRARAEVRHSHANKSQIYRTNEKRAQRIVQMNL